VRDLDKLPFASPEIPWSPRIERLRNNGQNAFGEYQCRWPFSC